MKEDIDLLKKTIEELREQGKIMIALLYGSVSKGAQHARSDIDLALYIKAANEKEEIEIIDGVLMSVDRDLSLLRLDDEDESPCVVQEALKGIHLIEPDRDTLYMVSHRVLHECEHIRYRRESLRGQD